ncbi:alpha/beta hydrolase family protein [Streptomyces sp. LP11]|uniref:Alpha/beta hydrolase family protein n=1 Tax=Streptomyces pyxinicus TaxID=2970331 RepID=A0ABT2B3B0_9ACTN|nr:alpha/beta hydrolase family protein [Streptomyces sp. LP11]MCS0603012.1 alpha/beta hydrolase family protein [Streptomyces sp. LP11]
MPTWQQLRDAKFTEYERAADGWSTVSNRSDAARTRADQEMAGPLRATQKGEAQTSAERDLTQLGRNYQYLHSECGLVRTALNALASELSAAQKKLKQALDDAADLEFTVNEDGSVEYPRSADLPLAPRTSSGTGVAKSGAPVPYLPGAGEADGDPNKGEAEDIAERISQAVTSATETDNRYAKILRELKAPDGLVVTDDMLLDEAHDMGDVQKTVGTYLGKDSIPHGRSPVANRTWWDGLTQEEREEYQTLYPAEIGALDGIPSVVRDSSNRIVLDESRVQVKSELDALGPEPSKTVVTAGGVMRNPEWTAWQAMGGGRLKGQLDGMKAIQARLDQTGIDGLPPAYLLGFDTKDNGHAIVANGNPDTADNTAVYVPGTKSKLAGAEGDIRRMTRVWKEANSMSVSQSTSTITWIGYDAPQSITPEAMEKHWAYEGAPKLNNFLDGLQTVQGGPDASHTTVIGHSYGSTTVGAASKASGHFAADDIVVAGSPGMLVGDASDLDVGKSHVWSEAASDDLVPLGGKVAHLGGYKWGVQTFHGLPYDAGYVQTVPSDEAFDAHRMHVDTSGHSGYWDEDKDSLKNQAAVVVGRYDKVQEDH